ncbi:hypothetical protein ABB07_23790 [Streptomyces incarnatus]|uniref:Uncharacterized protein n=1 Tax=Streptomyces incarnatus TaxID=665007 RepID=A0ABM5TPU7_9ACTN|nr:hypothetical protein ABB07_23790 [Streptomyces incarnatus]
MHVVRAHPELPHQRLPGRRQPALGAERGLGGAGRAGGEVQQQPVGGSGPGGVGHGVGVGGEEGGVLVPVRHEDPYARQLQARQQRQVGPLGDQERALGVQDVPGQFGSPARGVDPGDGRTGQGGGAEPERELLGVVEQHPDMRYGARRQQVGQQCRPCGGAGGRLVLCQHPPLAHEPRPVVPPPRRDQLGDRARHGLHGAAR